MEPIAFEDLKISDKLCIVLENGDCIDRVFFQQLTPTKLIVHHYANDKYITIERSSIIELSKYINS